MTKSFIKYKIINLLDKIFVTVCIFLIVYAWINFYVRNLWVTLALSVLFSLSTTNILFYVLNKRKNKKITTKENLDKIEKNFLAFRVLHKSKQLELLKLTTNNLLDVTIFNNYLCYQKDNKSYAIFIKTNVEKFSQEDLFEVLQEIEIKPEELTIVCNEYQQNIDTSILENTNIKIVNKTTLYNEYFLKNNIFPNTKIIKSNHLKFSIKNLIKNLFLPHKSKQYFFCGLVLIFSSLILPYHIYYRIFGTTLLLCSLTCKILPLFKN